MDDEDRIGELVFRVRESDAEAESPLTRAHLVESRIEDRYYTHCGRVFIERKGTRLVFSTFSARRCQRC